MGISSEDATKRDNRAEHVAVAGDASRVHSNGANVVRPVVVKPPPVLLQGPGILPENPFFAPVPPPRGVFSHNATATTTEEKVRLLGALHLVMRDGDTKEPALESLRRKLQFLCWCLRVFGLFL